MLWALLDFLHRPDFLPPFTLPYALKNLTKNPLNYYSLRITKFHGDCDKSESARTKKNYRAGRVFLGLKAKIVIERSLIVFNDLFK